jgi:hypothetical protein
MSKLFTNTRNSGNLVVESITPSTSSLTGSVKFAGGLGVVGDSFFGGGLNVEVGGVSNFLDTTEATDKDTASVVMAGGLGVSKDSFFGATIDVAGQVSLSDATAADSKITGSLVVAGGVGVSGNSYYGGELKTDGVLSVLDPTISTSVLTGAIVVTGGVGVNGASYFGGVLNIDDNTTSTNTSTGCLVLAGGMGVSENVSVGGNLTATGISTLQDLSIADSFVYLNSGNTTSNKEGGFVVNHNASVTSASGNVMGLSPSTFSTTTGLTSLFNKDFVQVSGATDARHNGIYEVDVVTDVNNFTVSDTPVNPFCLAGTVFGTVNDTTCIVSKVSVGVAKFEGSGAFAFASSSHATLEWKYPSINTGTDYENGTISLDYNVTARVTNFNAGASNTVKLPDNGGSLHDGKRYTVLNTAGGGVVVTVSTHGGNIDEGVDVVLSNNDRMTVVAANGQYYTV